MKRKTIFTNSYISIMIMLVLVGIIIWGAVGIFSEGEELEPVQIAVIVEDYNDIRWTTLRLGLERAAKDMEVDLVMVPTGRFTTGSEQIELIQQRVEQGADGIILAPYEGRRINEYLAHSTGSVQFMLIENDIERTEDMTNNVSVVAPDHKSMARHLFEEVTQDQKDITGKHVLILSSNPNHQGAQEMSAYLLKSFSEASGVYAEYRIIGEEEDNFNVDPAGFDVIVALDDNSLSWSVNRLEKMYVTRPLYGIGIDGENVFLLEQGKIRKMIVPNDFRMGYESVRILAENLRTRSSEQRQVEVEYYTVSSGEVYDPEIEKILFPVVQ